MGSGTSTPSQKKLWVQNGYFKYLSNGYVDSLKAWLVAKGYTQLPGFDFTDTFSLVVKVFTILVVLSLAIFNSWPLHQLDIKNAFLNGFLHEKVYKEKPPDYIDFKHPSHVWRPRKTLYGFK